MNAWMYSIYLQWQLSLRSKEILVHFYLVPLIFYLFIGNIFSSINPESIHTMIASMSIFGITMGGILGSPYPLVEFFASESKKAYFVGGIPFSSLLLSHLLSGLIHLLIYSIFIAVSAPLLFGSPPIESFFQFLPTISLIIMANLSIGMLFGLFFTHASKMSMATQLVFLPSLMLSGMMFPTELLPKTLETIGLFLPATVGFSLLTQGAMQPLKIVYLVSISLIAILVSIRKTQHLFDHQ